ncbi:hypothetical protein WH96_18005 [Kiloniella spongiae]|uniref:Anti-sigma factor antagonist n=1 Tax=Kiloniella spongiae TaxID=1489064 RepID=A0A0H2MB30_9PROT|nr:STAS domain-containing protein [Kiloniella spongiae]KLN59391.1 hypothetical protein WH96_18005 [Kiloniella spongiae]
MEYQLNTSGTSVEISLTGELSFSDLKTFRELLTDTINASSAGAKQWILNLVNLKYIDSAGLGLVLRMKATAEKEQKELTIRAAESGDVAQALEITKFHELINLEKN